MTPAQLRLLMLLASHGSQSVPTLAERLPGAESAVEHLCTVLVTKGLVIRVPTAAEHEELVVTLSTAGHGFADNRISRP